MYTNSYGRWVFRFAGSLLLSVATGISGTSQAAGTLTLGVVQMQVEATLTANRDKITGFIGQAKAQGCRLVVFPEGALGLGADTTKVARDAAIDVIRRAADNQDVYVIFCGTYKRTPEERLWQRLWVIGPDGAIIRYMDKLWYTKNFYEERRPFDIDGIPCSAFICSDRWQRGTEELPVMMGSQILIECSNNGAEEWFNDRGWFWYQTRALRNTVYVVDCNSAGNVQADGTVRLGHGHCAVIAPDGRLLVSAQGEADRLLVTTIDPAQATREAALQRRNHPIFKPFWEAGVALMNGESVQAPLVTPMKTEPVLMRIAAAQMACSRDVPANIARMRSMIAEAHANAADVIVFPELVVTGALAEDIRQADVSVLDRALQQIRESACTERMYVIFGMPARVDGGLQNCAYVIDPEGRVLTRYAQLVVDRPDLFTPGGSTKALWFDVKGAPAVVTVGGDARWSEIAELTALRGAELHFHLAYDTNVAAGAALLRRQFWANLASYRTFTATVNAAKPVSVANPSAAADGASTLWDDYHRHYSGTNGGLGGPYSAEPVGETGSAETLLYSSCFVPRQNPHVSYVRAAKGYVAAWYGVGTQVIYSDLPHSTP